MKRVTWFICIVLIGLTPFLLKLLIFFFILSGEKSFFYLINETDFILLGLIIHITNLKELKDINLSAKTLGDTLVREKIWIKISFFISIFCIIIYSGIMFFSYLNSLNTNININLLLLKIISFTLSMISIIFGFMIIDRISNIENQILLSTRKQDRL